MDEGLLDKESFTQDDDQAVQKFVTGKSFIIKGNSQTVVQHRTDMDKTLGEGKYAISKITVPGGTTELLQYMFSEEEQQFQKSISETKTVVKPEPPIPYSVEERERVTLLSTPLKDYTDQNTLKFILGTAISPSTTSSYKSWIARAWGNTWRLRIKRIKNIKSNHNQRIDRLPFLDGRAACFSVRPFALVPKEGIPDCESPFKTSSTA